MTGVLFDAAYSPNLDAVVAAGGIGMTVYLTGDYAGTCAQPAALHAKGLGVLGNYEEAADELITAGYIGGVGIGQRAAAAYIAKGAPAGQGLGIAFSVDVNAPASTFPAVGAAFDGIKAGLAGRFVALCYGEGALIDYLVTNHGLVKVEWLSASSSFPGWNPASPNVALVQEVGSPVAGTDEDKITNLAGLEPYVWWPPGSPYANGALFMALTDQQQTDMYNAVMDMHKAVAPGQTSEAGTFVAELTTEQNLVNMVANVKAELDKVAAAQASGGAPIDYSQVVTNVAAHLGVQLVTK